MRYESIKKRSGQWVRIRPALQVYDQSAVLRDTVEDAWLVSEITDDSLKIQSRDTQHTKVIGLDHIHNYMDDPEGQRRLGTTGTLVMNMQLLLYDGELLAEPVAPPGTPLKHFVAARTRETLFSAAARLAAEVDLSKRRQEFARSPAGVGAADRAFDEIEAAFKSLDTDLRQKGPPIDMVTKRNGPALLLGALGWWVLFCWTRSGITIDGSMLTVAKYHGHPPWPNVHRFGRARRVTKEQYTFGLVTSDEARWISWGNPSRSYSPLDLATKVLTELLERPNTSPEPFFDLE